MSTRKDAEKESDALRGQVKKLLTRWAARRKTELESAEWHAHTDSYEDVLIIITKREVIFRITIAPMEFSVHERRRRAWEKKTGKARGKR